ncbi:MAG: ribonuclease P subunit P30 [Methanobacteriaceae archaeon]|jgi:ribonuclease P/MRP protein subunit RPP1|nr:ribonuclease P subunit P30 [Methanobacteriaceae archaeon]
MYLDLNIKGNNYDSDLILAKEANHWGWNHISFNYKNNNYYNASAYLDQIKKNFTNKDFTNKNFTNKDFTIDLRCEISNNNCNQIQKNIRNFRPKTKCLSVLGGDSKVNRVACENIKIDILSRPYFKRKDCGINHVLAKEASENNVAIELCFKDILNSYLSYRAKLLMYFRDIINLYRKFEFPLILSSGASSIYDIRNPIDLTYFFKDIGLKDDEVLNSISNTPLNILKFNENRDNLILKGVKKIEGFNET